MATALIQHRCHRIPHLHRVPLGEGHVLAKGSVVVTRSSGSGNGRDASEQSTTRRRQILTDVVVSRGTVLCGRSNAQLASANAAHERFELPLRGVRSMWVSNFKLWL